MKSTLNDRLFPRFQGFKFVSGQQMVVNDPVVKGDVVADEFHVGMGQNEMTKVIGVDQHMPSIAASGRQRQGRNLVTIDEGRFGIDGHQVAP